jgi:iron complex outermembrane receptor protein
MLGFSSYAMAQRTVTGTVTDDRGDAVISATVQVKGTTIGTTTDLDGKYSIKVPEGSDALLISYIGYSTQEVVLGASNVVDVEISENVAVLDQVVVVGYGTQTRKEITSAVTSVKAEDFNQGNVQDPIQLIQGKVAGLAISTPGGDPNATSTTRLRGLSTIGANTEPLVVIDGVIGGSLNSVDPNDIASIDVLKDGSAAAIYGTRASSGVIIITTKKGRAGKTVVEYNGYITSEVIDRTVPIATAAEFVGFRGEQYNLGENTDWVDEVTRNGVTNVHNVSLSGGSASTTYRAAFNFRDVNGIGQTSGFTQLNGRLNLSQKALNDKLTLNVNISATDRSIELMPNEVFRYANIYNPTAPVRAGINNPLNTKYDGIYQIESFDYFNPVGIVEQSINDGKAKTIVLSGKATYEIMEGLTASAFVSRQKDTKLFGDYYNKEAYFRGRAGGGFARRFTEDIASDLFEGTVNYSKSFGKLDFDALAGYSYQDNTYENFGVEGTNFTFNSSTYNNIQLANVSDVGNVYSTKNNYKVIGGFARVNLNYDDTYFGMVSYRREGSSRFGANNKWGGFPAISGGVNFTKLADIPSVDLLKLRVGYGETGGLPPSSYLSIQQYNVTPVSFGPSTDLNANPNLRWETKGELNAGIDFAIMDYKLTGSVDYFNRITRDLILNVPATLPPYLAPRIWANLEDVELQSTGVEFVLSYNHTSDDKSFTWSPTVTFGSYRSTLNVIDNPDAVFKFFASEDKQVIDDKTSPGAPGQNNDAAATVIGDEEVGLLWGYKFVEFNDQGEYVYEAPDGTTFTSGDLDIEKKQVIGNGLPAFTYGINNSFTYNDFDFSFFLRGDYGHDLGNMYRAFYESTNNPSRPNDNVVNTEFLTTELTASPRFSSYYVEDASYMVLDNMTLGYTFKPGEGSSVSRVRVYFSGRNLFWITNYTGVDPQPRFTDSGSTDNGETAGTADPLYPGLDRRNIYFTTRAFTFGLNLTF